MTKRFPDCRFPQFSSFCLGVLLAGILINGGPLPGQESTESSPPAEVTTVDVAPEGAKPATVPQRESLMEMVEKQVDTYSGALVGQLAAVMFWEVGGSQVAEDIEGTPDVESVRQAIANMKAAGNPVDDLDFVLTVPQKAVSEADAKALQAALAEEFVKRTRTFSVNRGDNSELVGITHGFPFVVLWLVLGAVFFTFRMGFINIRGFKHAVLVTTGRYDSSSDAGEVSHFQALTAALSATVGLGNIAGVAIAVATGGPGATFWMIIAGLLGMSSKFAECTLGQKYREVRPDGRIMGGAMFYLSKGLKEIGLGPLGKFLGVLFAFLCVGASFGGGNAFQVNQSLNAVQETFPFLAEHRWIYGAVMVALTGVVIIGGIRRIASIAEKIVPAMCGVYVLACFAILMMNITHVPAAFSMIISEAFTPQAGYGGLLGVLILGFRRAAFSNEAGVGSAAIAHSAAKTDYPVREGIVALLEPFIDTVVICTMTALVIVITGAYENPEYASYISSNNGAGLTSMAMDSVLPNFKYVLSLAVFLFAYSTMISWSYYGERCWVFLLGDWSSIYYRLLFLVFAFLGSIVSATNVLDLSDLMILGMAFPNILGAVLLSGKVKRDLDHYWRKYKAGEFETPA